VEDERTGEVNWFERARRSFGSKGGAGDGVRRRRRYLKNAKKERIDVVPFFDHAKGINTAPGQAPSGLGWVRNEKRAFRHSGSWVKMSLPGGGRDNVAYGRSCTGRRSCAVGQTRN